LVELSRKTIITRQNIFFAKTKLQQWKISFEIMLHVIDDLVFDNVFHFLAKKKGEIWGFSIENLTNFSKFKKSANIFL